MKKLYSLIKASMSSDMSLFKINSKKKGKSSILLPLIIALYLMFMIWSMSNSIFEELHKANMEYLILSLFIISTSFMTFIEGVYKSSSLIFNSKDDELLLSLPIKRSTVLFIRIFKFYVFELLFNSIILLPVMISYIRWGVNISWTYYLSCFIMLLLLPIIPVLLSSIVGIITSSLSSRFKHRNIVEIIVSMIFLTGIFYISFNSENLFNYILKNASSLNDLFTKIYYPAGAFTSLIVNFTTKDLITFILVHIIIFLVFIYFFSKFYFKINSRLKSIKVYRNKSHNSKYNIKSNSQIKALVKKEINTFFNIPVFIINAGFALVLFIIMVIIISIKFDGFIMSLGSDADVLVAKDLIMNNLSVFIFFLLTITSFMTSITNSVISLEGKNINTLKILPVSSKKILLSKVLASLIITTPVLLTGCFILFIKFKTNIVESFIIVLLSILTPLVSHFIGIIINLKYPKFDWDNSSEVVKQSMSSFLSVMIGMVLLVLTIGIASGFLGKMSSMNILLVFLAIFGILDSLLYLYLVNRGVKKFNKLSI